MNTVIVADDVHGADNYAVTHSGTVGRNQALHYFFHVPAGHAGVQGRPSAAARPPGTGRSGSCASTRTASAIDSNASLNCYSPPAPGGCRPAAPLSRTDHATRRRASGRSPSRRGGPRTSASAPFTLTASILGATVSPNPD